MYICEDFRIKLIAQFRGLKHDDCVEELIRERLYNCSVKTKGLLCQNLQIITAYE